MIHIYNEDCILTMQNNIQPNSIDVVLTSPPYNNSRTSHTDYCMKTANCRYTFYDDNKTNDEYCEWICSIFDNYDRILKKDGVVLFNISYGGENPTVMFECVSDICRKTNFMIADTIVWKKKSAFPNNVSKNKLTRITEFVFIFCRKDEYDTFNMNKQISSYSSVGQPFYRPVMNIVEAANNDGSNELNKATYSIELCEKLLNMYVTNKDATIYDSFMGTGTTAVACANLGYNCIGSEIDTNQVKYATDRINSVNNTYKESDIDLTLNKLW